MAEHDERKEPIVYASPARGLAQLTHIGVLKQVREIYPPDHIRELADSMDIVAEDGTLTTELIQDTTIADLSFDEALQYLADHGEHYGIDHTPDELPPPNEEGRYFIMIAGHCRRLGIIMNAERRGYGSQDHDKVFVGIVPRRGITFEEALALQVRENFSLRPSVQEDAHNILRYFNMRTQRDGQEPSYAECSRVLGYSASKISEALRFARLPLDIREFAEFGPKGEKPALSFGNAVNLSKLIEAYALYHRANHPEEDDDIITKRSVQSVTDFAKKLVAQRIEAGRGNVDATIAGKIEELIGAAPYLSAEGLFELPPDAVERKNGAATASGRRMGQAALWALEYRQRHNEMTADEEERALALAERVRARRAARGEQDELDLD